MSKQHNLEKMTDVLALSDEEFERFIPDFLMWVATAKGIGSNIPGLTHRSMIWVDDGKPGEIHHINITDSDGVTMRYPVTAFQEDEK